jgi:hypothetical protein
MLGQHFTQLWEIERIDHGDISWKVKNGSDLNGLAEACKRPQVGLLPMSSQFDEVQIH